MTERLDPGLLVPRTCTLRNEQSGEREVRPLADFRVAPAYVLLGDPGAGKTKSFEGEAAATSGHYIRARAFAALDPGQHLAKFAGTTLFIDGLDEMRAGGGDGRTPLYQVRQQLDRLGRPPFRLSCREADWYGDSDAAELRDAAPGASLAVLHLDPLGNADIALLLERKFGVTDPAEFVRQAQRHGLADLLGNPQTLELLARAAAEDWPEGRRQTYDLACRQLVRECNSERRAATRAKRPTDDALFDAAGFLCAVQLLAGIAGFALDDDAADPQHVIWRELSGAGSLPLLDALTSGLFQRDEREQQSTPVHRSIAEFLGARYLAARIAQDGLPLGRVLALMAGEDGGIVADLRGLAAWLAVHCRSSRDELVGRDPLGVVLYGDVRDFPAEDKRRVLAALKAEADRYPNFRFEDWTATPFGALATPDMVPVFLDLLASPSRQEANLALLDCALDALRHGPTLAALARPEDLPRLDGLLDAVARDGTYPAHLRRAAVDVQLRDPARRSAQLVALAKDILANTVAHEDDRMLGLLLRGLYPEHIPPTEIFDYLRPQKQGHVLASYQAFWGHSLSKATRDDALPTLLDRLSAVERKPRDARHGIEVARMAGELLVRALEEHGDAIDDARLYNWLGAGLDEWEHSRVDGEHQVQVAGWFATRPSRYKAVLREGATRCLRRANITDGLYDIACRLFGAKPPSDIVPWYLAQAAGEAHPELARWFFSEAARQLVRQGGQDWLTREALDFLGPWVGAHPEFEPTLVGFTSLPVDHWHKTQLARNRVWQEEDRQRREDWLRQMHKHLVALREGTAPPAVLHDLAQVYLGHSIDAKGDTPHGRLMELLGSNQELVDAAYCGFRRSLNRSDLPSVTEIVDAEVKGRMHYIRQPCLVGVEELYRTDPDAAVGLDDEVLRKLLAFHYTWVGNEDPAWLTALVSRRPDLVGEVLVAYALPLLRKGREHVSGIWPLAYREAYADVARAALPELLQGFPLRAKTKLLANSLAPLLKAALRHLDRATLASILAERLARGSMSVAQRVYWLTCGLLIAPEAYEGQLATLVGKDDSLAVHVGGFLHDSEPRPYSMAGLPESSFALLIQLLAPGAPPERSTGDHWLSPALVRADEVRIFINALGSNPSDAARQQLERLLAMPKLAPWHSRLRHAAHTQRIARRKASFRHLAVADVCRCLANREPANVADLAALTYQHLHDLADKIRNGSTNDYRQYWSYDASGKPARPKPENECRNALLSDLAERLGRLGIDAMKEVYYAEDKRADIRVSFGGAQGFNVPIEIKKDSHSDLWRAIREQLMARYTRDPGAEGFGIYVVFWFGGKDMPLPEEGKKPRGAAELEERLRRTLSPEEARRISVCVIDCALPDSQQQPGKTRRG